MIPGTDLGIIINLGFVANFQPSVIYIYIYIDISIYVHAGHPFYLKAYIRIHKLSISTSLSAGASRQKITETREQESKRISGCAQPVKIQSHRYLKLGWMCMCVCVGNVVTISPASFFTSAGMDRRRDALNNQYVNLKTY